MVGEEKIPSYREIRTYYFQMRSAVLEHEKMLILSQPSDSQQVADLAKRVADAVAKVIKGVESPEQTLIGWQLEAEGAVLKYSEDKAPQLTNIKSKQTEGSFFNGAKVIEL